MCPSSGERTLSMRHWYFSLCMGGCLVCCCRPDSHPYLLTYLLTPRCRVLLEKLTGLQVFNKFPAFRGTQRFITALTSVRQLSLSWASPVQFIYPYPTSWRSVLILSTHLRLGLPSGLFPSGFPTKTLYTPSPHPYAPHAQPFSLDSHPYRVKITSVA